MLPSSEYSTLLILLLITNFKFRTPALHKKAIRALELETSDIFIVSLLKMLSQILGKE
jgi:hypothetical protein